MKIIDQQGNTQEVFQLEQRNCELYGQPKSIKKPMILLGKYNSLKRTIEVFSEAISVNSKHKNYVYKMPKD